MKRLTFLLLTLLALGIYTPAQNAPQFTPASGGGITQVSSPPGTCTNTSSAPVQITAPVVANGFTYGAGTLFYCDSTNHYSPVSQGSGASPSLGYYLGNQCPPSNSAQCFYTPANTQQAVDCSWSNASVTITCASSHFVAGDVGKRIMGYSTCNAEANGLASDAASTALVNTGSGLRTMTIATFISGTQITVGFNADNTASGNTHCLIWGTPDDTGAAAVDAAIIADPNCQHLHLAAARYLFTAAHFFTQPTACSQLGTIYQGNAANTVYAAGFELDGRGTGSTVIYLINDFPESGNCANGFSGVSCFVRVMNGRWSNIQFTGGQNAIGRNGAALIEFDGPGSSDNITCTNWGGGSSTVTGFLVYQWERSYQINNSGCGGIASQGKVVNGNPIQWTVYKYRVENNPIAFINNTTGYLVCQDCGFLGAQYGAAALSLLQNNGGGKIVLRDSQLSNITGLTNVNGYTTSTTTGSILISENTDWSGIAGAGPNSSIACLVSCNVFLKNTILGAAGTGKTYQDVAGSILTDQGGNTNFGAGAGPSISGTVVGGSPSASVAALVTGNIGLTSGWGASSVASVAAGSDSHKGRFTVTGAAGTANPTLTLTFPTAYPIIAPASCTMQFDSAGAFTDFTNVSSGTPTKTNVLFTFTGTSTAVTITLDYECGP